MRPFDRTPATIEQLPRNKAHYVERALSSPVYAYEHVGKDDAGRDVYQRYYRGPGREVEEEPCGLPSALIPYKDYVRRVRDWAQRCPQVSMGVPWWDHPCGERWDKMRTAFFGEEP